MKASAKGLQWISVSVTIQYGAEFDAVDSFGGPELWVSGGLLCFTVETGKCLSCEVAMACFTGVEQVLYISA